MRELFALLERLAPTELAVFIEGPTGSGKELVARALHEASPRAAGPFVVLDCAALPANLAESVLFGHTTGAFTGAVEPRTGVFEAANGGTVFIDEVGDLPLDLQPKLLRLLEQRQVTRLGENKPRPISVRLLSATWRDLRRMVNQGLFRDDLYFRLAQVRVVLPTLVERREDIERLVRAVCKRIGRPEREADVIELVTTTLAQHDWPGNVRELVNVTSVAASLPVGAESVASVLPLERGDIARESFDFSTPYGDAKRAAIHQFETRYFGDLFRATSGNVSEMARKSGMERHHIRPFLRKLGLQKT